MSQLHSHIEQLEQQLLKLIHDVNQQKADLQELRQENEALKKMLKKQQQLTIHPKPGLGQMQATMQQFSQGKPDPKLFNHYIKTIDECIDFLENC